MNEDKQNEARPNSREEALERLLEATLESQAKGTPDIAERVAMAEASGVILHEVDAPHRSPRLSFANVASAAGLVIALAALGFALFGSHFMGDDAKPENPLVAEQEKEAPKGEDRSLDFAPLGYQEALGYDTKEWPTAKSAAEVKEIVESETPTSTLVLSGSQITAQVLKDAVAGLPKLESLALVSTPLENEDMDALLGFKELRNLVVSGGNVSDPFLMQAWLLKLFPDEIGGMVNEKIAERKAWCQQLVSYSTNVEFPMEAGSEQDPFVRLGAKFFDNYFKNVQMLQVPVRTFQRFLRDKPSENVGGLTDLLPNLKHLSLTGKGISDDEMQGLATSIRRRSFLAGDDQGLAARLKLESFTIDLQIQEEKNSFTSRGLGYLRDGKIFIPESLLSLTIQSNPKFYLERSLGSLYPANFDSLEELRILGDSRFGARELESWFAGIAAKDAPSKLKRLDLHLTGIGNDGARLLLKNRKHLPSLHFLDARSRNMNPPLSKRLYQEFAPCEVRVWNYSADQKENFFRLIPYTRSTGDEKGTVGAPQEGARCFLHDLKSGNYYAFNESYGTGRELVLAEYAPDVKLPLPIREGYGPDVYDSMTVAAGDYEVVVIAEGYEIATLRVSHDGEHRVDVTIELKPFELSKPQLFLSQTSEVRYSVEGEDNERDGSYMIVHGERVLDDGLWCERFDEDAIYDTSEMRFLYDYTGKPEIDVLVIVDGLPPHREAIVLDKDFRKHFIWDGEKWSAEDIPYFKR